MMKRLFAVAVLVSVVAGPAAFAADEDITKGLVNLTEIHRIANAIELRRALAGTQALPVANDPWGTPYRISESLLGYRIVGAGSDMKFEEPAPQAAGQFDGLEGDVIFNNGQLLRSNRNWLHENVTTGSMSERALRSLRQAEIDHAMMRVPVLQSLTGAKATAVLMRQVGLYIDQNKMAPPPEVSRDAWGTPLKITIDPTGTYQIVSAGADRQFNETSWPMSARPDVAEDMIYENGRLARHVREPEVLQNADLAALAVPQPPDPTLAGKGRWVKLDSSVVAPVVTTRTEPVYPEEYRRARVTGIVILEVAVSESGTPEHVGVLKSLAPGIDQSAIEAVRQWRFKPATRDGVAVPVLFNVTINFKLK